MTGNQFDDLLRTRLEGHTSKVPDDMWQRINKKDKDRKGFYIPRWYIIAAFLLLIGVAGYFTFTTTKLAGNRNNPADITNTITEKENKHALTEKNNDQKEHITDSLIKDENIKHVVKNDKVNSIIISKSVSKKDQKKYAKEATAFSSDEVSQKTDQDIHNKNVLENNNNKTIDESAQPTKETTDKNIDKNRLTSKDSSLTADEDESTKKSDEENNKDKFSLEIFLTLPPALSFDNIHSDNKIYEQQLKDATKIRYALSAGARFDVRITKKISGKIGAQYTVISEKIDFTSDSLMTKINSPNFYKSVDIPILFSYKSKLSNDFSASVTSGILLNLSSTYKGLIPDPYGGTTDIKTDNVYNRNNGVSIYLGFGLSKNVKPNLDVFFQPYFIYKTKSITNSLQSFDRKIHTLGIEYGLRFKLFKKADE